MRLALALLVMSVAAASVGCTRPQKDTAPRPGMAVLEVSTGDGTSTADAEQAIRTRLVQLDLAEATLRTDNGVLTLEVPADGVEDVMSTLELNPEDVEFRPVLNVVGQIPSDEERADMERRIQELREQLAVPDGVLASDLLDELMERQPDPVEQDTDLGSEPNPHDTEVRGIDIDSDEFSELYSLESSLDPQLTDPADRSADDDVVLAQSNGVVYRLGPTLADGSVVESATASNGEGQWVVEPVLRPGAEGVDLFNRAAASCFNSEPVCPDTGGGYGQLAIVLQDEIISAPTINNDRFERDQISISGNFDEQSAKQLAAVLNSPSLDVTVTRKR